ncbi:helix-turn-helix domain-containing protein [Sulfurovum sp. CS9]
MAIIKCYQEIRNITQIAKEFQTTRLTVRKWVNRFTLQPF